MRILWLHVFLFLSGFATGLAQRPLPAIPEIPRRLPPEGIVLDAGAQATVEKSVRGFGERVEKQRAHPRYADVAVFHKALEFALKQREIVAVKKGDSLAPAYAVLEHGLKAVGWLEKGNAEWPDKTGSVVRGYRSAIDGSIQPYGLEIPEGLDLSKPMPLYVWLHGRGDTKTDLYFVADRLAKPGKFVFDDGIVLHPFGRQCIGWKSAGEIDVLEAIEDVKKRYAIDEDRIALMGFSMGGAGAWHLGAHYAERWAVVHAGAGFAETARYNGIAKEDYPVWYEQALWGLYDVPGYVRNLFNLPVLAYSGEVDKQMQAARVMEEAFAAEGQTLPHIIGPGMGHKYHPESQVEVADFVKAALERGRDRFPKEVHLQTRTLRYPQMHWVRIEGLKEHWKDSRVDAELVSDTKMRVTTRNVTWLTLRRPWPDGRAYPEGFEIEIDGHVLRCGAAVKNLDLGRPSGNWGFWKGEGGDSGFPRPVKEPGLQGPIDDAFFAPFLVVTPSGKSKHPKVQRWVEFELAHFRKRWSELFRGELREKKDTAVTANDRERFHLILWGDANSNALIRELEEQNVPWPIRWDEQGITVSDKRYAPGDHVLTMIYPNPRHPASYVVLNSGPTFREAHDRTNSLQNPKLPDWAVINLDRLPDAEAPGEIAAAGFFDEEWQIKK